MEIQNIADTLRQRREDVRRLELLEKAEAIPAEDLKDFPHMRDTIKDMRQALTVQLNDDRMPFLTEDERNACLTVLADSLEASLDAYATGKGIPSAENLAKTVKETRGDLKRYNEYIKADQKELKETITLGEAAKAIGNAIKDNAPQFWQSIKDDITEFWKKLHALPQKTREKVTDLRLELQKKRETKLASRLAIAMEKNTEIKKLETSKDRREMDHTTNAVKAALVNVPIRLANAGIALKNTLKFISTGEMKKAMNGEEVSFKRQDYKPLIDADTLDVNRPWDITLDLKHSNSQIAKIAFEMGLNNAETLCTALDKASVDQRKNVADNFVKETLSQFTQLSKDNLLAAPIDLGDGKVSEIRYGKEGLELTVYGEDGFKESSKMLTEGVDYEHISDYFTPSALTRLCIERAHDKVEKLFMEQELENSSLTRSRDLKAGMDAISRSKRLLEEDMSPKALEKLEAEAERIAEKLGGALGKTEVELDENKATPEQEANEIKIQGDDNAPDDIGESNIREGEDER